MKRETRSELQKLAARCLLEISGSSGGAGKAFFFAYNSPGEGATTALSALGEHLGRSTGVKTLLVDGNLRTPSLHAFWGMDRSPGLVDACIEDLPVASCARGTRHRNVFVLPGGNPSEHLDELYTTGAFRRKVLEMKEHFRLLLFDSSPLLEYNDTLAMAQAMDGALLLARSEFLPASVITKGFELLKDLNVNILGSVLNRRKNYVPQFWRHMLRSPEDT